MGFKTQELKRRILYIAKNIPIPTRRSNHVILNIAKKLETKCEIDILYPKEIVPWGVHFLSKYRPIYNLQPWSVDEKEVKILKYIRIPNDSIAFLFAKNNLFTKKELSSKYDLIHGHFVFPDGIFAYQYAQQWDISYVVTVRESDLTLLRKVKKNSSTWTWAVRVLKNACAIHVLNLASKNYLEKHFNLSSFLIPHGIEASIIQDVSEKSNDDSLIKISVVGEAIATKQIDWVIRAIHNYSGSKKISLTVIGEGKQLAKLKTLARNNSNIYFLGKIPQKEVFKHLSQSDIFALPSCKESFGLVYLEAAAHHNAIIGYKNTGIFGVFEEEKEIIYVNKYKDFEDKLFYLIENKDARIELSRSAFERVKQLTWEKVIEKYVKLYDEALKKNN